MLKVREKKQSKNFCQNIDLYVNLIHTIKKEVARPKKR